MITETVPARENEHSIYDAPVPGYGWIYGIFNKVNSKVYIGQTQSSVHARYIQHSSDARRGVKSPLCQAIRDIGDDVFYLKILDCVRIVDLNILENDWIYKFNSANPEFGYNVAYIKNPRAKSEFGDIYGIRCKANGKWYVGQTTRFIEYRYNQHLDGAFSKNGKMYDSEFYSDIRKYGRDVFELHALIRNIPIESLNALERYWVRKLKTRDPEFGYNKRSGSKLTPGTPEYNKQIHEEHREAHLISMKKYYRGHKEEIAVRRKQYYKDKLAAMTEEELAEFRRKEAERMRKMRATKKAAKLAADNQTTLSL